MPEEQPLIEGFEAVAQVRVDREICQTAATCLSYHIYELDDEAKAVLLTNNGDNSDNPNNPLVTSEGGVSIDNLLQPTDTPLSRAHMQSLVLESAQACPFNAIIVTDDQGNQIWPKL